MIRRLLLLLFRFRPLFLVLMILWLLLMVALSCWLIHLFTAIIIIIDLLLSLILLFAFLVIKPRLYCAQVLCFWSVLRTRILQHATIMFIRWSLWLLFRWLSCRDFFCCCGVSCVLLLLLCCCGRFSSSVPVCFSVSCLHYVTASYSYLSDYSAALYSSSSSEYVVPFCLVCFIMVCNLSLLMWMLWRPAMCLWLRLRVSVVTYDADVPVSPSSL